MQEEVLQASDIACLPFDDWFTTTGGFVGIRPEYQGYAVYEFHSETKIKRHWYSQKMVALALYDELRMYLEA